MFNDRLLLQWPLSVDFGLIKFELWALYVALHNIYGISNSVSQQQQRHVSHCVRL